MDIRENIKAGKYINPKPYPNVPQVSRQERAARGFSLQLEFEERYKEHRIAVREWTREVHELEQKVFKNDLFEEYGVTGHPKAEKVWALAWREGHAEGLASVVDHFEELVELIK
jgi:hypothetical protein